jgi:DNA topoisomerase-1
VIDATGPGLRFVTDAEPGIRRRGRSRFRYVDARTGEAVRDPAEIGRIRALAVPPAWTDVWICPDPCGHLQATGRDSRGRKVYRYHTGYREARERAKFDELPPFGHVLGDLRSRIDEDLGLPGLPRDRVAALVVSLLERTFVRVGNEEYARDNRTFGLTTLRDRHAEVHGSELHLRFRGKGARLWDVGVESRRLARLVRRCQDLPGQVLFQYVGGTDHGTGDGEGNGPVPLTSTDVNDYLRRRSSLDLTAKSFRTWGGTLLAACELAAADRPASERGRQRAVNDVMGAVADVLGNTPAVSKGSYVHPAVVGAFDDGTLPDLWDAGPRRAGYGLSADERRLLHVLDERT